MGQPTYDGVGAGAGFRGAGSIIEIQVTGRSDVPGDAAAVLINLTAIRPDGAGYLTVYPCGQQPPVSSNVNYGPGDVAPNAVLAMIGAGGKVCVFSLAGTHLAADINGYVPADSRSRTT